MLPIIPTRYKGYTFRHRSEARWAVFFDAMGVGWEYEREGYDLPSGRYLPDFYLTVSGRAPLYFEVKQGTATPRDLARCRDLALLSGVTVVLAEGTIPLCKEEMSLRGYDACGEEIAGLATNADPVLVRRALRAARGAQFEFESEDR